MSRKAYSNFNPTSAQKRISCIAPAQLITARHQSRLQPVCWRAGVKTILIEEVANGWIVRNYDPAFSTTSYKSLDIHVYQSIEDLQNALPELLAPIKD